MAGLDGDRRERDKAKCCEAGPMGRARPADPSRVPTSVDTLSALALALSAGAVGAASPAIYWVGRSPYRPFRGFDLGLASRASPGLVAGLRTLSVFCRDRL